MLCNFVYSSYILTYTNKPRVIKWSELFPKIIRPPVYNVVFLFFLFFFFHTVNLTFIMLSARRNAENHGRDTEKEASQMKSSRSEEDFIIIKTEKAREKILAS